MDLTQNRTNQFKEFSKKQKVLLDEWQEKAMKLYLDQNRKFIEEMYSGSLIMVDGTCNTNREQLIILENLFKNLTTQRGEIKHQQRIKQSIARKLYMDNQTIKTFRLWREGIKYKKYLRAMKLYCSNYAKYRIPRIVFETWRKSARTSTRSQILQQVNKQTENEILQMQKEYEAIISQLENVLEKRLVELKVEEEAHKELVNRYEGIVEKRGALKH